MCYRVTITSGRGHPPDPRSTSARPREAARHGPSPEWPRPRAWTARRTRSASVRPAQRALACPAALRPRWRGPLPARASGAHDGHRCGWGSEGARPPASLCRGRTECGPKGYAGSRPLAGREPAWRTPSKAAAEGLGGAAREGQVRVVVVGHVAGLERRVVHRLTHLAGLISDHSAHRPSPRLAAASTPGRRLPDALITSEPSARSRPLLPASRHRDLDAAGGLARAGAHRVEQHLVTQFPLPLVEEPWIR